MRRPLLTIWLIAACLSLSFNLRGQDSSTNPTGDAASGSASGSVVPRLIRFTGAISPQLMPTAPTATTGGQPQNTALSTALTIAFSLYELQEGGAPLWSESQEVQVDAQGHYTVLLGANTPTGLPLDLFTSGKALWVGVQPQLPGQAEQPRVLLVAVPYALKSSDADTLGGLPASAYMLLPNANTAEGSSSTPQITLPPPISGAPPPSSASITGLGTANYAAMFTGSATIGNSLIYNSSLHGFVGIGTTAPAATLHVNGTGIFSGTLAAAGLELPATATATGTQGFASSPMDWLASSFNSGARAAVPQLFRWKAEPAANNTTSPSGTLNLQYLSGTGTPAETGLSISSNGQISFASGQTFAGTGTGTVTSVASGAGLTGGPITTSGTLSIATGGVTNALLANSSLTVAAGTGLSGGGLVSLGGSTTLNLASASCGAGQAAVALPLTCLSFATLGANNFTGNQTVAGNVGIGTTTPAALLDVEGTTAPVAGANALQALQIAGGAGGQGNNSVVGGSGSGITLSAGAGGINSVLDLPGGAGSTLTLSGGAGASNVQAGFGGSLTLTAGAGAEGASLEPLGTNGGSISLTAGAGVGGTSPAPYGNGGGITLDAGAGGSGGGSGNGGGIVFTGGTALGNGNGGGITLQPGGKNSGVGLLGNVLLAPNGGLVGVGTTTPAYTLDVNGTGHFTGLVTFAGGQTFTGSGAGLTNLTAANISAGTADISITGNAANATELGGVGVGNYARLDIGNTFTGNQTLNAGSTLTLPANGLVAGTNQLVLSSGSVGIGTTTPAAMVDVEGVNAQLFSGANAAQVLHVVGGAGDGGGSGGALTLSGGGGGEAYTQFSTAGTGGAVVISGGTGGFGNAGGANGGNGGGITLQPGLGGQGPEGQPGSNGNLLLAPNGGLVGIGNTNPAGKLTVSGSESSGNGKGAAIELANTASGGANFYLRAGATGTNTPAAGFSIADDHGYRISIDNSGKVGIGTNNPQQTLDVNGTGNFTGLVTFASGQTFPGLGTVTSVGSGSGLTGGPITGSGSLSITTGGVTNAMLANPSLTVLAGSGLSGGGSVALGGSVTLNNTGTLGIVAGTGLTSTGGQNPTLAVNTSTVPQLGASNTFTQTQNMDTTVNADFLNANTGALTPGIIFGNLTGEGISSKRTTGGNQYGLDFYTNSTLEMSITNSGSVGIGTNSPYTILHIRKDVAGALGPSLTLMNGGGQANAGASIDFDTRDPGSSNPPTARVLALSDGHQSSHLTFSTKAPGADTNALVEQMRLTDWGVLNVDSSGTNGGFIDNNLATGTGLVFGAPGSGEGMASNRTTSPNQYGLDFYTNYINRMAITQGGNVGIGTTAPAAMLEVNGTAQFDQPVTFASGQTFPGTVTAVSAGTDVTGGGSGGVITLNLDTTKVPQLSSANTFTGSSNTFSNSVNVNATVNPDYSNLNNGAVTPGILFGNPSGEGIASRRTSTITGNQYGLDFYTNNAARMSVAHSGFVGIGTTNPYTMLHLVQNVPSNLGPILTLMDPAGGSGAGGSVDFDGYDPGANLPAARIKSFDDGNYSADLGFMTKNPGAVTNPIAYRMWISSAGNVGINTTTPATTLEVNGNARIDQTASIVGNTFPDSAAANNGSSLTPGIIFGGSGSGEGIASNRTGSTNQYGLNFYTNNTPRLSITNVGGVGLGVQDPGNQLEVNLNSVFDGTVTVGPAPSSNPAVLALVNNTEAQLGAYSLVAGNTFNLGLDNCSIDGYGDLLCTGSKSAVVPVDDGARKVALYAVEAPENWFEDAGSGQLVNGVATIALESTFAQTVNGGIEYHVFLTPKGDCEGLYVTNETPTSFEVHELRRGHSSIAFDYRIMAKRKGYENIRLADKTEQLNRLKDMGRPAAGSASSNGEARPAETARGSETGATVDSSSPNAKLRW